MRKLIVALVSCLLALPALAALDDKARDAIWDIQNGRDTLSQIKVLRVKTGVELPAGSISNAALAASGIAGSKVDLRTATMYVSTNGYLAIRQVGLGTNALVFISGSLTNVLDANIAQ